MSNETQRYDMRSGVATAAKREINGNTYMVIVYPKSSQRGTAPTQTIMVYGDTMNGGDFQFPKKLYGRNSLPDKLVSRTHTFHDDTDISSEIAKAVNKAVRTLEGKLEQTASTEDAVLGALDANEEVHTE